MAIEILFLDALLPVHPTYFIDVERQDYYKEILRSLSPMCSVECVVGIEAKIYALPHEQR